MKAESQTAAASESIAPNTSNPSMGVDLSSDVKKPLKLADDDDEVLNLVKVKEPKEQTETEAGSVAKEEGEQKCVLKLSDLLKSESSDDVKKEHEKDDDDTLSESEPVAGVKPLAAAAADGVDTVKDECAVKLRQKDDADEEMDHSTVPSPCPEVR